MVTRLVQDTVRMLQQQISPDADISLEREQSLLEEMASLLRAYELERSRKLAVLGCYGLLRLALARHRELAELDGKTLAKRILDGDYLTGVYFRFVLQCNERQLLTYLAPIHKKLQIGIVHGATANQTIAELFEAVKRYLDEQCKSGGDSDEAA
ncbi:hypothetical protein FE782_11225 [Paenibacillus antri]|uniref:Uncharacterized protein n=1 Tax=Paenibacillus antri TaxID=2582848 RepID=A0A5R9GA19_9BACL|nr:hypothetical protein [Paenibacillus antri]TLS51949.1 hypothetical protein FE782_11225 [Paenibacillus antri]